MSNLPELHEGHAPITLHELFRSAIAAYEEWEPGLPEPEVSFERQQFPISAIFEHMRRCTDLLPNNLLGAITERLTRAWESESPLNEMTAATAARIMCILVRKRQKKKEMAHVAAYLSRTNVGRGYFHAR